MAVRVRPFRIGVMSHETSVFRPLMGMTAAADGGLIVWPRAVPSRSWVFARVELPGGRHIGQGWMSESRGITSDRPPKVHYHRSGWVSANLTGAPGRQAFRGLPLARMHGQQFFSFTCGWPEAMPEEAHKRNDVMGVAHGGWPVQFHAEGFLYASARIRSSLLAQIPRDHPVWLVRDERAEIVIDLRGHGTDLIAVVRVHVEHEELPTIGEPHAHLIALDSSATEIDGLSPAMSVWTDNLHERRYLLTRPELRPFARWTGVVADPLETRHRVPGRHREQPPRRPDYRPEL